MNALADIDAQSGQELPAIVAELLSRACSDNERLLSDVYRNIRHLEYQSDRMSGHAREVNKELTRWMLECEALALASGPPPSAPRSRTRPLPGMSPPPEEVPLIDISPFSSAPASPVLHPWQSIEISPSPSPRDSPPPGYPGSPHSSDDYYTAEELSELTSIPRHPAGDDHISRLTVLRVEDAGTSSEQPLPTSIAHELVPESHPVYSATSADYPVGADTLASEDTALPDECILQSLVFHTSCVVERYCTFLRPSGEIYVKIMPLPDYHYLNPAFQDLHRAALEDAI
ncbi:hypothetical protein C8J57DRAFT_1538303 [Mycena rebaudengoi]|nr:hypothetical protein C8J57DRAFT_1538303 [Mycena rebaudengoi]